MPDTALPVLDCKPCGACCQDVGVPPYTVHELFGLPRRLMLWMLLKLGTLDGNPRGKTCIAYRKGFGCRIYHWRPAICRDLVVPGNEICLNYRRRFGAPA
jgi:Fe-S-cluster containining protein